MCVCVYALASLQVLAEFMSTFEAQGGGDKGDGIITVDEFKK